MITKEETTARPPKTRKHHRLLLLLGIALVVLLCAVALIGYGLWHSQYQPTEDSFYTSAFVKDKTVLVVVPHEDDETNLAFGVIDTFTQAGSKVIVAFATNGDFASDAETRVGETTRALAQMGVPEENIVLLGYGDHFVEPIFCLGKPTTQRTSDAGFSATYGTSRITDFHTQRFGEPAPYAPLNLENDLYQLVTDLQPDILFVSDTDNHSDHISLSQLFDHAMGRVLREHSAYRPQVFKGFAYEYAWHGNGDFYQIPLASAAQPWVGYSYQTAYAWRERVRFPVPSEYLSYTLRGSKLRSIMLCYESQNAVAKQINLLNSDRIFWERRADALFGDVTATSGEASRLQDFVLSGSHLDPLSCCWTPDPADAQPEITFTWDAPQTIDELVFYNSPAVGGIAAPIHDVSIMDENGNAVAYTLTNNDGLPCRVKLSFPPTARLTIRVLTREGERAGFSEIEVLPSREQSLQWLHLLDPADNFLYEYASLADEPFELGLYGYPYTPTDATATIFREGSDEPVTTAEYADGVLRVPSLAAGRYRIRVTSEGCSTEVLLRIGDKLYKEYILKYIERMAEGILPD